MIKSLRVLYAVAMTAATLTAAPLASAPAQAAMASVTVPVADDVFVSQAEPAKSFATAAWMSVCGSTCGGASAGQRVALTRFKVTGIPDDAANIKATLDLTPARTTSTTVSVREISGAWTESATTWATRPAAGETVISSHTGFTAGRTVRLDVSKVVTGNDTYAFALTGTSATTTVLHSSRDQAGRGPKLTISYTPGDGEADSGDTGGPLPFAMPSTAELRGSARKVFAHYFPPFPLSIDNQAPSGDYYARNWLKPEGENGKHTGYGGFLRDRPIPRAPQSGDWELADLKAEVKQAIAAGLDGFTVDILSLSSRHWTRTVNLIKAAEAVDPGFKIIPMPDMTALTDVDSATLAASMAKLATSKSAYRLSDGRLVISPFKAEARTPAWWSEWIKTMDSKHGIKVAFVPCFLDVAKYRDAFSSISYGMGNFGHHNATANAGMASHIERAHAMGKIWMQPIAVQDVRPNQSIYEEAGNTDNLRVSWKGAIDAKSEWVQLVTWNDYSEGTHFAPSANAGWTFLDITSYYLTCFKLGCPKITKDVAYLTHRVQPVAAKPAYPQTKLMQLRSHPAGTQPRDTVEVLTMLKAAGTVTVNVGGDKHTYAAPAGVHAKTFPLKTGTTSASVSRQSAVVAQVESPYKITSVPYVQDLHYHGVSSGRS